jgi:uncharacterized membrane protein YfcA
VQQAAQGTALLALIPIWVIGALTHHKTDTLRLREAATVGSCGALTVPIGAQIASHLGAQPLRLIFAAFLITTVGWGLLHTQRRKPAPQPETGPPLAPPLSLAGTSRRGPGPCHDQHLTHRSLAHEGSYPSSAG